MSNKSTTPEFQFEVILQEDPETKELILPIPQELMQQMGWVEGDEMDFNLSDDGKWVISKK